MVNMFAESLYYYVCIIMCTFIESYPLCNCIAEMNIFDIVIAKITVQRHFAEYNIAHTRNTHTYTHSGIKLSLRSETSK